MSCSFPFYRIAYQHVPPELRHQILNKGIVFGRDSLDYYRSFVSEDYISTIPCGKCMNCRLKYSRDWAIRCMLEAQQYKYNYFCTLTYSDSFLPSGQFLTKGGEIVDTSLDRSHIVKFIKRLRRFFSDHYDHTGARFFYCGEYGDFYDRPHFHFILFNAPAEMNLSFFKKQGKFNIYRSSDIEACWTDPKTHVSYGFSTVQEVSFDACAYVARYVIKKQTGLSFAELNEQSDLTGIPVRLQPFCGMSRRPGIGKAYFDENYDDIYYCDTLHYNSDYRVFLSKPPRYFDKLYDIIDPEGMKSVKLDRSIAGYDPDFLTKQHFNELESQDKKVRERERRKKVSL